MRHNKTGFRLRFAVYKVIIGMVEEIVGKSFVRLLPFKDHINIEANAVVFHKEELAGYKFTPKGMLQIYLRQEKPSEILKQIFAETLG